jgi:RimK family alpha-L-glutamate ligase
MAKIALLKGNQPNEKSEAYATFRGLSEIAQDQYELIPYADLVFSISDDGVAIAYDEVDLKDFDLVYIRDFQGYEFERNAIAQYLAHTGTKFLNTDVAQFQHISKLTQYMAFSFSDVAIPRTLFAKGDVLVSAVLKNFSFPVILKSITGNSGKDNFMIESASELNETLDTHKGIKFIVQEFIPNQGDLRMIVLGDSVTCISSRVRKSGDHRNNIALGGDKTYLDSITVDEAHQQLAIKAAKAVGREICGVDVMVNDTTGSAVILEANFNFGIRAISDGLPRELYGLADYLHKKAKH